MANTFAPNGFKVFRRVDGAEWTGNQVPYLISSTNTGKFYSGDPVTMLNTGYVDVSASGTTPITGIFVGCKYLSTAQSRTVWSSTFQGGDTTTDVEAYVIDDPWATFIVQCGTSGAVGGPAVQSDVQLNFAFAFGTGSSLSGQSGAYLDYTTHATTSTLPFRLMNLLSFPPGANGYDLTTAGNLVEVVMNNQNLKTLTGI